MNNNNDNTEPLYKEISRGIIHAENHGNGAGGTILEGLSISGFLGIYYTSWWLFGGALIAFAVLMFFNITRIVLFALFTIGWVFIAWIIGHLFGSLGASVVLSCLTLLISGGLHLKAYQEWNEGW
ncbi:hypothetical protein [Paenibacillus sp. SN-8-1]|uniref:hypothetical protein n=1 Tax=Paenibacillus sp. SN-8-1 TaxID=3435409 RepID=UPI003D9AA9B0